MNTSSMHTLHTSHTSRTLALHMLTVSALLISTTSMAIAQSQSQSPSPFDGPSIKTPTDFAQAARAHNSMETPPKPQKKKLTKSQKKERLRFLLSGYEYFPTRTDLDRVGDAKTISALLRDGAQDTKLRASMRTRAIDALGYYNDALTKHLLITLIMSKKNKIKRVERRAANAIRHHAIVSLARSQGKHALPTLIPLLAHKDLQIKLTAVHATGTFTGHAGKKHLQKLYKNASNPILKRELRKHIKP